MQQNNIRFFQTCEKQGDKGAKDKMFMDDLEQTALKTLLAAILQKFSSDPHLVKMDAQNKSII